MMIFFAGLLVGWVSFVLALWFIGFAEDDELPVLTMEDVQDDGSFTRIRFKNVWYVEDSV